MNNVTGKLATKLDTSVFNEFKSKSATKEELEEKTGNALAGKADKNHTHYQLITESQPARPTKNRLTGCTPLQPVFYQRLFCCQK
ncbi:hypothetical protein [Eikenella corrodens]|uniref:hypothetical protein n=1 Tax=Eikenella corrodens TaxID=539 RepID=UPI00066699BA|nr:hypothetical protein [Eikenella corrodens]